MSGAKLQLKEGGRSNDFGVAVSDVARDLQLEEVVFFIQPMSVSQCLLSGSVLVVHFRSGVVVAAMVLHESEERKSFHGIWKKNNKTVSRS